jgi:hypothetical protein
MSELYVVVTYAFYNPGLCLPGNIQCRQPHFYGAIHVRGLPLKWPWWQDNSDNNHDDCQQKELTS